jgi:hypothetical protein
MTYTVENNRIWKNGSVYATVWGDLVKDNKIELGETYLEMRKRTEPDRNRVEQKAKDDAIVICALLNMRSYDESTLE